MNKAMNHLIGVPDHAICLFQDGNMWCATYATFVNLQESPAGFGSTWEDAVTQLKKEVESLLAPPARETTAA